MNEAAAAKEAKKQLEQAKQAALDSWGDEPIMAKKPKPKQTGGKKKKGKKGKKK